MTENDLDKLEAQGLDVSAYREQLAERRAREAEQQRRDRARWNNPTSLERLTPYVAIPRSMKTQFFKRMAGRAPWFRKIKWLRKYTEGLIVYVGVVKAPDEAWKGEKHDASTHTVVGVYATDDAHACNAGWVSRVALALRNMSEGKQRVAPGCERIIDMIADEGDRGEMAGGRGRGGNGICAPARHRRQGVAKWLSSHRRHSAPLLLGRHHQVHPCRPICLALSLTARPAFTFIMSDVAAVAHRRALSVASDGVVLENKILTLKSMKMKRVINSMVMFCMVVLLAACKGDIGSLVKEKEYPMDKAESYAKLIDMLKEKVDQKRFKIVAMSFCEKGELTNSMLFVNLTMVNPDNMTFKQTFYTDGTVGDMDEKSMSFNDIDYKKLKGIELSEIDPAQLEKYITEAKKLVPQGCTFKSVRSFDMNEVLPEKLSLGVNEAEVGSIKKSISIGFTEDGKETEESAGKVVNVYYTADVNVNPDGTVSLDD